MYTRFNFMADGVCHAKDNSSFINKTNVEGEKKLTKGPHKVCVT